MDTGFSAIDVEMVKTLRKQFGNRTGLVLDPEVEETIKSTFMEMLGLDFGDTNIYATYDEDAGIGFCIDPDVIVMINPIHN